MNVKPRAVAFGFHFAAYCTFGEYSAYEAMQIKQFNFCRESIGACR